MILDRHYVCQSLDPILGIWSDYVKKSHLPWFFVFASFLLFVYFFTSFLFRIIFILPNIMPDRASSCQLIVESCASPSINLISLSYSMVVFSANLFGLFCLDSLFSENSIVTQPLGILQLGNLKGEKKVSRRSDILRRLHKIRK